MHEPGSCSPTTTASGARYPTCIGGRRRCPPEDCGGPGGYVWLLEVLANPEHEEYKELREWAGGDIDPDAFDPSHVMFDDPEERRAFVLS